MNPIAVELNEKIKAANPAVLEMLSELGKEFFFPKGILTQTAEAKEHAKRYNATIGIAKEKGKAMYLPSLMKYFNNLDIDEITPYAPSPGQPGLRKIWQEQIFDKNKELNPNIKISLPVVTNGITHGLSVVGDMFVDSGDIILIPDKIWGNYRMTFVTERKAVFKHFPLFNANNGFNIEGFEKAIIEISQTKKKVIVLLNFPNNPIGYSPTVTEAKQISDILLKYANPQFNIIALIDDAYFGLFFENDVYTNSIFTLMAGKNSNLLAIKLDAATKEDFVWGFRCGFLTFGVKADNGIEALYDALEKKAGGCIRGNISNCSNVGQSIMTKLLKDKSAYIAEKKEKLDILKARAVKVKEILKNPKYDQAWTMYPFNSGYFMCVKMKDINSEEYRKFLLHQYGVGVISPDNTDIRIAFSAIDIENIQDMFDVMLEAAIAFKKI